MHMNDELTTYIRELIPQRNELLTQMEQYAQDKYVPILDLVTAQYMRVTLKGLQPLRILEVGAAIGYSAIVMAEACQAQIVTIERDSERAEQARFNIAKAGFEQRIQLLEGDAFDILPELEGNFDLIFLDAAKGQYPRFLELVLPLLRKGGTLLSDNVFFHGMVAGEQDVNPKHRTIVNRLRDFNQLVANHPMLDTAFIPMGDGIAVSVKV